MAVQAQTVYSSALVSQDLVGQGNSDYGNLTHLQYVGTEYFSQNAVSAYFQNQRTGMEFLLNAQSEKLSRALQEQRWLQIHSLLQKHEPRIRFLIKAKEDEIARAWRRRMELEEIATRVEMEKESWQKIAKEKEAAIVCLMAEQMKLEGGGMGSGDTESRCSSASPSPQADLNSEGIQKTRRCRICQCRESCVIMLPCRHLCCCAQCDPFLQFCPVCKLSKRASFEAFLPSH